MHNSTSDQITSVLWMVNKMDLLQSYVLFNSSNIIAVTEARLSYKMFNSYILPKNCTVIRKDHYNIICDAT